jgi:hypothetical protein
MSSLRGNVIIRPHVQHASDCDRACSETFACVDCKRRKGSCLAQPFSWRLCQRCAAKRRAKPLAAADALHAKAGQ